MDGLIVVPDRAIVVVLRRVGKPTVVEGLRIVGNEPDRFGVVLNRTILITFRSECITTVREGPPIVWIEPDRLVIVLNRAIGGALSSIRDTAAEEG